MAEAMLWEWAKDNGHTPESLAKALGYTSPRYVELVLRGWETMSDKFIGRFVQAFPADAFVLFNLSEVSDSVTESPNLEQAS